MTCSRRSMFARTRSTKGTRRFSPGERVRLYRPRRSTTLACACGTMVRLLAQTMINSRATTSIAMSAGVTLRPLSEDDSILQRAGCPGHPPSGGVTPSRSHEGLTDDRGGPFHLENPHRLADGERLAVELAARCPLVGAQL